MELLMDSESLFDTIKIYFYSIIQIAKSENVFKLSNIKWILDIAMFYFPLGNIWIFYFEVRPTAVNGRPLDYPGGYSAFLAEKNRLSLELAKKVAHLNNDAFLPFLWAFYFYFNYYCIRYVEFERLIADFYNGHSRILGLFNISMFASNLNEFL